MGNRRSFFPRFSEDHRVVALDKAESLFSCLPCWKRDLQHACFLENLHACLQHPLTEIHFLDTQHAFYFRKQLLILWGSLLLHHASRLQNKSKNKLLVTETTLTKTKTCSHTQNNRPLGQTYTPQSIVFILALYLLSTQTKFSINNGRHDNKHSLHACTNSATRSKQLRASCADTYWHICLH